MTRTYRQVSPTFWGDEKVAGWNDDTRLLALYLLTCEHKTAEGLFRLPIGYILADLRWTPERFRNPFETLSRDGFLLYDERVSVIFLTHALEYQPPANPNQVTGAMARLQTLPETPLMARLYETATVVCPALAETLSKAFPNGFETVSKHRTLTQALTQEKEQGADAPAAPERPARTRGTLAERKAAAIAGGNWTGLWVIAMEEATHKRPPKGQIELFGRQLKNLPQPIRPLILEDAIARMVDRSKGPTLLCAVYGDVAREADAEILRMQMGGDRNAR
jgi:hypothetical protein